MHAYAQPAETLGRTPILVVDDQAANLLVMQELLQGSGLPLHIVSADSGNRALRLSLQQAFALILLDVQMPGMDGYEVAELLRANPKTRPLPIIFVTAGMTAEPQRFRGYEAGAVDYLAKPIEPLLLIGKVRVFCELFQQRRQLELNEKRLERVVAQRSAALIASEAQLRHANEVLEQRVLERSQELRIAIGRAAAAEHMASLGRLVAGVAHEMNTPIGNILLAATTQRSQAEALFNALSQTHVSRKQIQALGQHIVGAAELIASGAARAARLIEDFKQLAVERPAEPLRRFALQALIEESLEALQQELSEAKVQVQLQLPPGLQLLGYPEVLRLILKYLLSNSLRHAFGQQAHAQILISAATQGGRLSLSYSDNGCGVPEQDLPRLFEPFFTGHLGQGGSGLGLALVHNLTLKLLQGRASVENLPGQGLRLSLDWPLDLSENQLTPSKLGPQ